MKRNLAIATLCMGVGLVAGTGCGPTHPATPAIGAAPSPAPDRVAQRLAQYQATLAEVQALQPPPVPPSTVGIAVDQSGSMGFSRIATATYSDVKPVVDALVRTGGTLALSKICDRSDVPLVRTTFAEPPRLGQLPAIGNPPERPKSDRGDPFQIQKHLKQYEKDLAAYEQQLGTAQQTLDAYKQQLSQHQQTSQQQLERLKPEIEAILNHPRNCQATDIQRAIERTNVLFQEPIAWSQPPRTYAVFITDGLDTFSSAPAKLQADKVVLVNGSETLGIFQSVRHERFEAPQVALSAVADWMLKP